MLNYDVAQVGFLLYLVHQGEIIPLHREGPARLTNGPIDLPPLARNRGQPGSNRPWEVRVEVDTTAISHLDTSHPEANEINVIGFVPNTGVGIRLGHEPHVYFSWKFALKDVTRTRCHGAAMS